MKKYVSTIHHRHKCYTCTHMWSSQMSGRTVVEDSLVLKQRYPVVKPVPGCHGVMGDISIHAEL